MNKLSQLQSARARLKHDANALNDAVNYMKAQVKSAYDASNPDTLDGRCSFSLLTHNLTLLRQDKKSLRAIETAIKCIKKEIEREIIRAQRRS